MSTDAIQREFHDRADTVRHRNRTVNPYIVRRERRLASVLAAQAPAGCRMVLDVGAGEGSNVPYLMEALPGCKLISLDFAPPKVRFLLRAYPGARAVCADARNLPFKTGSQDMVLGRDLLHHVDAQRQQVVAEALRVLRPGGKAMFLESDGRTVLNRLFRLVVPAERGMANSTPRSLLDLGRAHGRAKLVQVEASQVTRAAGYALGWPEGLGRWLASALYELAGAWEHACERLLPRGSWPYQLLVIEKSE